jgi:hypothetical protein
MCGPSINDHPGGGNEWAPVAFVIARFCKMFCFVLGYGSAALAAKLFSAAGR